MGDPSRKTLEYAMLQLTNVGYAMFQLTNIKSKKLKIVIFHFNFLETLIVKQKLAVKFREELEEDDCS